MLPAAIGTQVGGSIIRPAGYCGNFALKPTQGGINRGERQATSMSTHGVHAACIEDMWQVAIEIASRAGGDRGAIGLVGGLAPPAAIKPQRLMVLETEGFARLDEPTRQAFAQLLEQLERAGVAILTRRNNPDVEALERAIGNGTAVAGGITGWENRWGHRNLVDQQPDGVSQRLKNVLARSEAMSVADYYALLRERELAQVVHARVKGAADAAITLSCPGPAPLWPGDEPGKPLNPRPTGDAVFNYASSMLFAPVVTVPLLGVGGMPVGVQLMGQQHEDERMTALARWVAENVSPVVVG
jgi:Asp-tRNA(Asn)/Glu-tRNA(Gln) amidotransferase A subunit family amidase